MRWMRIDWWIGIVCSNFFGTASSEGQSNWQMTVSWLFTGFLNDWNPNQIERTNQKSGWNNVSFPSRISMANGKKTHSRYLNIGRWLFIINQFNLWYLCMHWRCSDSLNGVCAWWDEWFPNGGKYMHSMTNQHTTKVAFTYIATSDGIGLTYSRLIQNDIHLYNLSGWRWYWEWVRMMYQFSWEKTGILLQIASAPFSVGLSGADGEGDGGIVPKIIYDFVRFCHIIRMGHLAL